MKKMLVAMLAAGSFCLAAPAQERGTGADVWVGNNPRILYPTCRPSSECKCGIDTGDDGGYGGSPSDPLSGGCMQAICPMGSVSVGSGAAGIACSWIRINTGPMKPGSMLPGGFFSLRSEQPTPDMASPQGLRYVMGYAIHSFSRDKTSGGMPRNVFIVNPDALTLQFTFADGSSIAPCVAPPPWLEPVQLMTVDAEGWETATNAAYYDLYTGKGDLYRFVAATNSGDFMQLALHRTVEGRAETSQDIGIDIIRTADESLRQVRAPLCLADIVTENSRKYAIKFYRPEDVQAQKDTNGYYVAQQGASPTVVWTIENPDTNSMNRLRISQAMGLSLIHISEPTRPY